MGYLEYIDLAAETLAGQLSTSAKRGANLVIAGRLRGALAAAHKSGHAEGAEWMREECAKAAENCNCFAINRDWQNAQQAIAEDIRALPIEREDR